MIERGLRGTGINFYLDISRSVYGRMMKEMGGRRRLKIRFRRRGALSGSQVVSRLYSTISRSKGLKSITQ